jgi:hypothetical protein
MLRIVAAITTATVLLLTADLTAGACCHSDGICTDLPDDGGILCDLLFDGTWIGDGTNCKTSSCDVGACCIPDFEYYCEDQLTPMDCEQFGGDFLGILSTCENEGGACDSYVGACCVDGVDCWDSMTELACSGMGGEFLGLASTCNNEGSWCTTYYGACCYGDACEEWVEHDECDSGGGISWPFSSCDEVSDIEECGPDTYYGACCYGDACEEWVEHDTCESGGGIPWPFSSCDEVSDIEECGPDTCDGDLNNNGSIDVDDLLILLAAYQINADGDCNGDGDTDVDDVLYMINAWGECS